MKILITKERKALILFLIVLSFVINRIGFEYSLSWAPAIIVYFVEKKSYFIKYNALLLALIEVIRNIIISIISFISLQFNLPYLVTNSLGKMEIGSIAYIEMILLAFLVLFKIYIAFKVIKEELIKQPEDKSLINSIMKNTSQYYDLK